MIGAILDASAVIALLMGEPGADRVAAVITESAINAANLAEVVGYLARRGASEREARDMIGAVSLEVMAFDAPLAYAAGLLLPATRAAGLSLGDRACLALARQLGVKVLTTDRAWAQIAVVVDVTVEVIR